MSPAPVQPSARLDSDDCYVSHADEDFAGRSWPGAMIYFGEGCASKLEHSRMFAECTPAAESEAANLGSHVPLGKASSFSVPPATAQKNSEMTGLHVVSELTCTDAKHELQTPAPVNFPILYLDPMPIALYLCGPLVSTIAAMESEDH